jgi:superfamily I DNA/RNA helicase
MNIISAAAGSGKSTKALHLAKELIVRGFKVVYTSITNVSVDDAKDRFSKFFSEELTEEQFKMFTISTVHSYCLDLLRKSKEFEGIEIVPTTEFTELKPEEDIFVVEEGDTDQTIEDKYTVFKNTITSRFETYYDEDKNIKRRMTMPLDWVIRACKVYKVKAPQSDAIIIDEYQDMEQHELHALADIFDDNAWLWGDINQSVYLFRSKSNQAWKLLKSQVGGKVETYRFNQYSSNVLNKYLQIKTAILPTGASTVVEMFSNKENNEEQSIVPFHWRETIDGTKYTKALQWDHFCYAKKIYEPIEKIIEEKKDTFQIITMSNSIASVYSTMIIKKFGRVLSSWYIPVHSHPVYKIIRDTLREDNLSSLALNTLPTAIERMQRKLGYNPNRYRITESLTKIAQGGKGYRPRGVVSYAKHPSDIITALEKLTEKELDPIFKASAYASKKTNIQSALNVITFMSDRGLKSAMQGVQLQSENSNGLGRVTTIHTSKGTEADYVLLDIQGQIRTPRSVQDLIQNMNMVYVAMSRQRKKLWVAMRQRDLDYLKEQEKSNRNYFEDDAMRVIDYFTGTAGISFEDVNQQDDVMTGIQQRNFNSFIPYTMSLAMKPEFEVEPLLKRIKGDTFAFS